MQIKYKNVTGVIVTGAPSVGKTTICRYILNSCKHILPSHTLHLISGDCFAHLSFPWDPRSVTASQLDIKYAAIANVLLTLPHNDSFIVVDDVFRRRKDLITLWNAMESATTNFITVELIADIETLLLRNTHRSPEKVQPEDVIININGLYSNCIFSNDDCVEKVRNDSIDDTGRYLIGILTSRWKVA